jgi:serine/threonine protein kinase
MSDQAPNRPEDRGDLGAGNGKGDSQLRLVTADGNVVFPEYAEPTDDSPTIISKNKPSEAVAVGAPALPGNLHGRKLAHFELLEPIGVGGMAAVLRARDTQLERVVALKILPPDMAQDEENVRRFHQEARAAAKLDHENIARVFYCGEDQKLHFIAFEFVEGVNLRVLLEQRGRLPVPEAVRIILQIATGLEHAASRGVVHRDVKPSNIIISPNGRAKLVDMGLARSLEPHNDGALTQSGVTLGTFDYISPEQALEPREADSRSDVYSLGCTFYHMLTGQATVPEGTAAKKLHHHQHLAPADPRQFNPEIPDEVIDVLNRMMAKDPKDRYQRPVHLVQHMLQVAQKVGAADDVPEGVLFVDAPLRGDPRKRPLLLVSFAALALALVLVLLSLAPQPKAPLSKGPVATQDKPLPKEPNPTPIPNVGPAFADNVKVSSEAELAAAFVDPAKKINVVVTKNIDLPPEGLQFKGEGNRTLTVDSEPNLIRKIRFKYVPKLDAPGMVAGLILDGGTVIFNNIRFEIEGLKDTPEQLVASLGIRGSGTVTFNNCVFVQIFDRSNVEKLIPQRQSVIPVASIAIENTGNTERPTVILEQCSFTGGLVANSFTGGQVAVGVRGPAEIHARNCAFRPYAALFHLRGDDLVSIRFEQCCAFVINGPAFRLDDKATCNLELRYDIFSRPDNAPSKDRDEPDLIRQTDNMAPAVKLTGFANCYHGLNALWVRPTKTGTDLRVGLDDFRALVQEANGEDRDSYLLAKEAPVWISAAPWNETSLEDAFHLRHDVREVRSADLKKVLGFEKMGKTDLYVMPAFPKDDVKIAEIKLGPKDKVVDPDAAQDGPKVFSTLHSALGAAKSGDRILIKHGKAPEVRVSPGNLVGASVTLAPYPGYAPVLQMSDTADADAAFFRMFDAKLVVDRLEFALIEPSQANFKAQAVVFMIGNGSCTFKNCVITMRSSDALKHAGHAPLSLVSLADPEEAMQMPVPSERTMPEIQMENCFVRGEGEVVTMRGSRPLKLGLNNVLVGLAGSLLTLQAVGKEPAADSAAYVSLKSVSAFVTEPLLAFHTAAGKSRFVPTNVDTKNSLFVRMGDGSSSLIASDGAEDSLAGNLQWKGDHNGYCNFDKAPTLRMEETQTIFKDTETKILQISQFNLTSMAGRTLWTATPDLFVPRPDSRDELPFGANLVLESLPRLTAPKKDVTTAPE